MSCAAGGPAAPEFCNVSAAEVTALLVAAVLGVLFEALALPAELEGAADCCTFWAQVR